MKRRQHGRLPRLFPTQCRRHNGVLPRRREALPPIVARAVGIFPPIVCSISRVSAALEQIGVAATRHWIDPTKILAHNVKSLLVVVEFVAIVAIGVVQSARVVCIASHRVRALRILVESKGLVDLRAILAFVPVPAQTLLCVRQAEGKTRLALDWL